MGSEYVLVAVELVLESGAPSAEHVENMLNRLKSLPMHADIDSPLEVSEEPIADTGRHDRLHDEVADHARPYRCHWLYAMITTGMNWLLVIGYERLHVRIAGPFLSPTFIVRVAFLTRESYTMKFIDFRFIPPQEIAT